MVDYKNVDINTLRRYNYSREPESEVTILHHFDYWDGFISGVCEILGQKYWFQNQYLPDECWDLDCEVVNAEQKQKCIDNFIADFKIVFPVGTKFLLHTYDDGVRNAWWSAVDNKISRYCFNEAWAQENLTDIKDI